MNIRILISKHRGSIRRSVFKIDLPISLRVACKLIIFTVDRQHEMTGDVRRIRFGCALSRLPACFRTIRHRIIRRQVRCGSQQLGKLEGVVFYFRDVQRASVPRVWLPFILMSSVPFCGRFLRINPFLLLSRSSFVNATESETRRQMSHARLNPL